MKFVHASASLALLSSLFLSAPTGSAALKCGIAGVTKQCLGKSDVRYDSDASYDLADQDDFWGDFSGLYVGDYTYAAPDWSLLMQGYPKVTNLQTRTTFGEPPQDGERAFTTLPGSYDFSALKRFVNFTVSGSRFHYKVLTMAKSSIPGMPGVVLPSEVYCKYLYVVSAACTLNLMTNYCNVHVVLYCRLFF